MDPSPVGRLEVQQHEDVEQFGAGSRWFPVLHQLLCRFAVCSPTWANTYLRRPFRSASDPMPRTV